MDARTDKEKKQDLEERKENQGQYIVNENDKKEHNDHDDSSCNIASAGIVEKGDPTSFQGVYVVVPLTSACFGELGNELFSYELDARTEKEI